MTTPNSTSPRGNRKSRSCRANGQGSVYQRKDGKWVGAAYLLQRDGTYKRHVVYGDSETAASRKLVQAQAKSDQGIPAEATGWTVARFLTYWIEQCRQTRSQTQDDARL